MAWRARGDRWCPADWFLQDVKGGWMAVVAVMSVMIETDRSRRGVVIIGRVVGQRGT